MSDLKNITINDLPFKENLDDTNILHISDGQDKQSTLARLWEWAKLKVAFTTSPQFKNVLLATSDKKLERIPVASFFQGTLGGLMNSLTPLNDATLAGEGYSELAIFIYRIARTTSFRTLGEYFYMDVKTDHLMNQFLNSPKAQEYLLSFGITLANGENGSRDARGVFLRATDAGAGRESEERQIGQLQRDAMQKITGEFGTAAGWNLPVELIQTGAFRFRETGGISRYGGTGSVSNLKFAFSFDSSRVARTATETRPQNITALLFQKVKEVDWHLIPATPPTLIDSENL